MRKVIFRTLVPLLLVLVGGTEVSRGQCNLRCSSLCFFLYVTSYSNPSCGPTYPKSCVNYWIICSGQDCQDESCCYIA